MIIVDADVELRRARSMHSPASTYATGRPVQGDNVVSPEKMTCLSMVSALAFLVRNRVRARGLRRLGLPCHLTGTGMAFTWDVVRKAPPTGAYLAEDLLMGLELARLGHPPMYTNHAGVHSLLPAKAAVARKERSRWEHGQMTTVRFQAPRLLREALRERRLDLFALGMDLTVPPLALLVAVLCLAALVTGGAAWLGASLVPFLVVSGAFASVGLLVLAAYARFGRATIPARYVLAIPFYALWKLPVYLGYFLRGGQRTWDRTERAGEASSARRKHRASHASKRTEPFASTTRKLEVLMRYAVPPVALPALLAMACQVPACSPASRTSPPPSTSSSAPALLRLRCPRRRSWAS